VRWAALDDPARWDRAVPTLFVSNHTNWWDGFFSFLLTRELGMTCHVLMEALHLNRYKAFKSIGTLPVRRDSLKGAYADLETAGKSLRPNVGLWIYPQGQRRPAAAPIENLERGAAHLATRHGGPLRICPVAFRYAFLSEQLPEAFALIGDPWLHDGSTDRSALTSRIAAALNATVGLLDEKLLAMDSSDERRVTSDEFRTLVPGRLSINKRLDHARHRLGLLAGDFDRRNG
jgi:1-acyl-sn-glycerol-3-phosphate acyltransferase